MRFSSIALALSGLLSTATALDAIEVVGNKFFNKDGSQFFLKGSSDATDGTIASGHLLTLWQVSHISFAPLTLSSTLISAHEMPSS